MASIAHKYGDFKVKKVSKETNKRRVTKQPLAQCLHAEYVMS